jgi:hypothetical protein
MPVGGYRFGGLLGLMRMVRALIVYVHERLREVAAGR